MYYRYTSSQYIGVSEPPGERFAASPIAPPSAGEGTSPKIQNNARYDFISAKLHVHQWLDDDHNTCKFSRW